MKDKAQKCVGILSMQRIVNFGSVLQAYSLRTMIRQWTGASVYFLDIDPASTLPCSRTVTEDADYTDPADYPPGILQRGKRWCIARLSAYNRHLIRRFMDRQLQLGTGPDDPGFDAVVIGSDEVFNHVQGVNLQLHGQVSRAERVISYAASCGCATAQEIAPEDLPRVQAAMAQFRAISVRDAATRQYAADLGFRDVTCHLDPVLVGDLCQRPHRPVRRKKYLLVYAYGQRIRTKEEIGAIQAFAKERGLQTVAVGGSQFWCDRYVPLTPFRLLDYFHFADYVVTDTFHGAVFSVIHQKEFVVLPRKTNAGKIKGLLADLGLEHRRIPAPELLGQVLPQKIDYGPVNAILQRERERARQYIKEQLEG